MKTNQNKAYLLTALAILFWGGAASAFKIALQSISPLTLLLISVQISLLTLATLLILSGRLAELISLKPKQWISLSMLGFLNPFFYYLVLLKAYDLLPGQVAMSLNYLWPLMLVFLAVPILGQKLSLKSALPIGISFLGTVIIASRGEWTNWGGLNTKGLILALLSTVIWASYWLLSTQIKVDAVIKLFVAFLFGSIFTVIFAASQGTIQFEWAELPWLSLIYVGLFEMGLTFWVWLKALEISSSPVNKQSKMTAKISNLIYITPFLSLIILTLVTQEQIFISTITGLTLIIFGIIFQHKTKS